MKFDEVIGKALGITDPSEIAAVMPDRDHRCVSEVASIQPKSVGVISFDKSSTGTSRDTWKSKWEQQLRQLIVSISASRAGTPSSIF
jgi:hypothetical protein